MTVQIVAVTSLNADADAALSEYLNIVGPLMQSAGAKILSRFELGDNIAGSDEIQYVSVIEYPDEASVKLVFDSDEYKLLEKVKRQAFSKYQVNMAINL